MPVIDGIDAVAGRRPDRGGRGSGPGRRGRRRRRNPGLGTSPGVGVADVLGMDGIRIGTFHAPPGLYAPPMRSPDRRQRPAWLPVSPAALPRSGFVQPCAAANPAIGSRLQSWPPAGRVAELGSFGDIAMQHTLFTLLAHGAAWYARHIGGGSGIAAVACVSSLLGYAVWRAIREIYRWGYTGLSWAPILSASGLMAFGGWSIAGEIGLVAGLPGLVPLALGRPVARHSIDIYRPRA